jgi:two-component system, cell cycle sensor histidine kinase and response regulator CckA
VSDQVILIVDDDFKTLLVATAILLRAGYTPIAALDPLEALTKSREFGGKIHLLLTDMMMPKMDGLMLAQKIFEERANIRILLMSGVTNISSRLPFLRKPFQIDQLLEKVANVLASPQPVAADVFGDQECSGGKAC